MKTPNSKTLPSSPAVAPKRTLTTDPEFGSSRPTLKHHRVCLALLALFGLCLCAFEGLAQSPSVIYTWAGTNNVQQWFRNFGAANTTNTLGNSIPGELTVTETSTAAGGSQAISDGFNRIRESSASASGGLDVTGLDYLEFDLGHSGTGNINAQFFVQASPGSTYLALGPDLAVSPGVNTYQVPLTGLTAAQAVYIRTIGINVRDHVAEGNLVWTLREVRAGGTPLTSRDLITHDTGTPEGGLQGAIVNFDNAAVLGNNGGQNQTGLSHNPAGSGSMQWTDVGGQSGAAIGWGNGTAWNGNTFNNREADLSNYGWMTVRISAAEVTPGAGGSLNVQGYFQVNNFSFQSPATRSLPIDGQFHDLTYPLAGLANMNLVDITGINLGSHATDLLINVDLVRFDSLDTIPPRITCPSNLTFQCLSALPPCATNLAQFLAMGGTASDNFDTDLTYTCSDSPLVGDPCGGTIFRTHCVVDDATNTACCVQIIRVNDTIPPTIHCPPPITVLSLADVPPCATNLAQFLALPGAAAGDNCYGDLEYRCSDSPSLTNDCGRIFRTHTVIDDCTNSASCLQVITVLCPGECPPFLRNFDTSDGGFTVENVNAPFEGPWTYNGGAGTWSTAGQGPELGRAPSTSLTSPPFIVGRSGPRQLAFVHRYSFEFDGTRWDGGQVRVSVNGGAFVAVTSFSMNGYGGNTVAANSASALAGQPAFTAQSAGYATPAFITSIADLGPFNAGDILRIQFLAAYDTNTRNGNPAWEIDSVAVECATCPPVVNCPTNIVVECSGGLTPVTYVVTAFDCNSNQLPVICVPPSGSGFRRGTTNVVCTATDSQGQSNSCTFTVTVVDTTLPIVNCPSNITAIATSPSGAVVTYIASAADPCGLSSFDCQPPSGSTFPIGVTTVTCVAADLAGNTNACSFTVTVQSPNQCPTAVAAVHPTVSIGCMGLSNVVIAADNSNACVVLDGTMSSDPDGDALSYSWTVDGVFNVSLDGAQDGGGARMGSGSGTVTLSGNTLNIDVTFSGLSVGATAAHIHGPAAPGVNASVLYPLNAITTLGSTAGTINGNVTLVNGTGGFTLAQQLQQLRDGRWYINIHNSLFPGGEIRGQITATAQGATVTNCLPIGSHEVCLRVSDGLCPDTACVTVEVISPCQAIGTLIATIESSSLPRNRQRPLIATLKAACASFERGDVRPGVNQLEAFQNKVRAQVAPADSALAAQLIDCAQAIIDAVNEP